MPISLVLASLQTERMRNLLLCLSLVFVFINSRPSLGFDVSHDYEFDYIEGSDKGPDHWGDIKKEWATCRDGKMQSPIDLTRPTYGPKLGKLRKHYKISSAVLQNAVHEIKLKWEDGGFIFINGVRFKLEQCHWHSPSEHTINSRRYDLELHMVHKSDDGKIAVIGALYEFGKPDYFLSKLTNGLETLVWTGVPELPVGLINPWDTMLGSNCYYRYMGSLTTPPCSEGVTWTVIAEIKSVARWQVELLKAGLPYPFKNNSRPLQPKNGRPVEIYFPTQELQLPANEGDGAAQSY